MRAVDLIIKKRDGGRLSAEEIGWLIEAYSAGQMGDEQMAAWAMAVLIRGMDAQETADLTLAMARSGEQLDLHDIAPLTVDKHSTGGIGDKTSLLLGPLVAAIGLPVAKMSGRGLGFSGGTIDKLESIPGMRTELSGDEFRHALREVGLVIAAQSLDLAPADKRLYALRDVTGTVESIPLIAASIMSKKLAAGADCIVLDVKLGSGAFMRTLDDARALAQAMVGIGQRAGRRVAAVISSMQQPLGLAVGNALEVREALAGLRGHGPPDLVELCLTLGAQLALLAGAAPSEDVARARLREALASGAALDTFLRFVRKQGGSPAALDDPQGLPQAPVVVELPAPQSGYVAAIQGAALGNAVNLLGGGRIRKGDQIDPAVGLVLAAKVGQRVRAGQSLLQIHARSHEQVQQVTPLLQAAYAISAQPPAVEPLVYEIVREERDHADL
jgi:pyrimidine-nucleoside phosphorylase